MNFNGYVDCCNDGNITPPPPPPEPNRIISPDLTSSVTATNFGVIQSVGSVNFNENSLGRVTQINAGTTSAFGINKANIDVKMDNDLFEVDVNTLPRIFMNDTTNIIITPDGGTAMVMVDDAVTLATTTNGVVFTSTPGETKISNGIAELDLNGTTATFNSQVIVPTLQDPSNPDIRWADNSGTGLYSSSEASIDIACNNQMVAHFDKNNFVVAKQLFLTDNDAFGQHTPLFISTDGLTLTYIENRAVADADAPYGCIFMGANNFIFGRANRSGGVPTSLNQGGMTIGLNGYCDMAVGATQRSRYMSSNLYSENGAITVTNSTTETALYTVGTGSPSIGVNSENLKIGGVLQFNILFSNVAFTLINSLRIRVRGTSGGIAGTVLVDSGTTFSAAAGAAPVSVTINLFRMSANVIKASVSFSSSLVSTSSFTTGATWNPAVVNTLSLTAQMGSAIAANTFTYDGSSITMLG